MKRLLLPAILLASPAALSAKWFEASSDHFVVYADDSSAEVKQFSEQLERFHSAMAFVLQSKQLKPSPSNRVTVFVVKNEREVRKLAGDGPRFLYAFYRPRAGSSIAIVPQIDARSGVPDFSMIALLHEYAHHFQLSVTSDAWPRWFVEGSAEFFASAKFGKDGSVMLGMPAQHRAAELFLAPDVSAKNLLDPATYRNVEGKHFDAYYGRAWLLYHYLVFEPARQGQLTAYLDLLKQGKGLSEAAGSAFGDLTKLDRDMDKYLARKSLTVLSLNAARLQPATVAIRELSAGEAATMPIRVRSRRGVSREQALELLPEARAVAARYPKDAPVLAALSEAEYDAGNDDPAIAAADAALALDPTQVNAYIQKGYALFRKADKADDRAKAFREAQAPFLALNKIENDHPIPLIYYYLSFQKRGMKPNANATDALAHASALAPFDPSLRFMLIQQQIHDKQYDAAMANLEPLAFNPHGGPGAEMARKLLDALKSGQNLDGPEGALLMQIQTPTIEPEPKEDGKEQPKAKAK